MYKLERPHVVISLIPVVYRCSGADTDNKEGAEEEEERRGEQTPKRNILKGKKKRVYRKREEQGRG